MKRRDFIIYSLRLGRRMATTPRVRSRARCLASGILSPARSEGPDASRPDSQRSGRRAARAWLHRRTEYRHRAPVWRMRTRIDSAKLAAEMVERQLDVIVALSTTAAHPAQQATRLIPIVAAAWPILSRTGWLPALRARWQCHGDNLSRPGAGRQAAAVAQRGRAAIVSRGRPLASARL